MASDERPDISADLSALGTGLAHEIKNPLSTLVLNAQILREDILDLELPEDRAGSIVRRVDTLTREANRLKDILEDFLRYAGRMVLDRAPTDLRLAIDELADFIHPQCDRAGVRLRVDLPAAAVVAPVDARLIKQALLNLLVNALQAMGSDGAGPTAPSGSAHELIVKLEPPRDGFVWIHVIDTGPGIEPEKATEVFRPYVTSKKSGSGLGLPTARRIAVEHGGTLDLHTTPGVGCDFVMALPTIPPQSAEVKGDADGAAGAPTPASPSS